ncbi:hypothetical protein GCM10010385_37050 [Streptomyces geysiriensis]|nr:hypothetical protein GCM10010385_37050 [Streptomyces geysiriensis]
MPSQPWAAATVTGGAVVLVGPVAAGTGRAARSGSAQAPATPVGGTRGDAFLILAGRGLHER